MMRKIIALSVAPIVLISSLISPTASAVPKSVAVKKIEKLFAVPDAEGLIASGKNLITFSNTGGVNSNVVVNSFDQLGANTWQLIIDSGVDEVATTAATDSVGNIWLAGSSALAVATQESRTATASVENPDGVILETIAPIRADMNQIALWQVSPAGQLLATYIFAQSAVPLVSAISINNSGISLVGKIQERSFLINSSLSGVIGKALFIGSSKTNLTAVVRGGDGSVNIFGDSTETLAGKKLAGIRDGILVRVAKNGVVASVVRSSAIKGDRTWLAADSTLALTGSVKVGRSTESAVTRFNASFAPLWTVRYPSNGSSQIIAAAGKSFVALGSTSAIKGLTGWRPSAAQLLLLTFDSKGKLLAANGASDLVSANHLAYSKEIGLFGIATARDASLHIFKVN